MSLDRHKRYSYSRNGFHRGAHQALRSDREEPFSLSLGSVSVL